MKMSVLMNIMIPLMCHFMYARGVTNSTEFLLSIYDILIDLYDVDVYNKLYETAISNVLRTAKRNQGIWAMQDIRGVNTTIHTLQSVQNILINIMPKYVYSGNLVHLNYKSILRNTGFQILDIELDIVPYSSNTIMQTSLIAGNSLWRQSAAKFYDMWRRFNDYRKGSKMKNSCK